MYYINRTQKRIHFMSERRRGLPGDMVKCKECGEPFELRSDLYADNCPDHDERFAPGNTVREVILEGGEALRLDRGLQALEDDEDNDDRVGFVPLSYDP